jgi:hypothetical protein
MAIAIFLTFFLPFLSFSTFFGFLKCKIYFWPSKKYKNIYFAFIPLQFEILFKKVNVFLGRIYGIQQWKEMKQYKDWQSEMPKLRKV